MPPVLNDNNIYSEQAAGKMSATVKNHKPLVYVPNNRSDTVTVIDPMTFKIIRTVAVGQDPQHVVPSWDMTKLFVTNNAEGRTDGSLTPIDPVTGEFGTAVPVDDPYNMYYTPDGKSAVVVAEAFKRLDLRDPVHVAGTALIATPTCGGINHADFSGDGTYAVFTCEFEAAIVKVDWRAGTVVGRISFGRGTGRLDAARRARRPRRQHLLRRRHDQRRRRHHRRRDIHAKGFRQDRHRHARHLPVT